MSSRKRQIAKKAQPATKRRKTVAGIGAHNSDDDALTPHGQANAPSTSALSERVLVHDNFPSLSTICTRSFAGNLQYLRSHSETIWMETHDRLRHLPDALSQKVFAELKQTCPTLLGHGLIVAYFLRGTSVVLGDDLPGVNNHTIAAIGTMETKDKLRDLELVGLSQLADNAIASLVSKLPSLRKLNLRGCSKVGQQTVDAVAQTCTQLEVLNLNYTAVPAVALAPVLQNCKELRVLKVAGIPSWTDATCSKLWTALGADDDFHLPNLHSLKLRQATLSDAVINPVLAACPNLQRLDLSFTHIKHPILPPGRLIEKLVLTSTNIAPHDLVVIVSDLPKLKNLAIGAMGGGTFSSISGMKTSTASVTDHTLQSLTDVLQHYPDLAHVNLVGNNLLGSSVHAALGNFVRRVGRKCKVLNLADIPYLKSTHLEGLAQPDEPSAGPPHLVHLNLNNTAVDDTAAPSLSSCVHLQTLKLANTKFTSAGLFPIIDACEHLEKLDLTSCRGVGVKERRRFFEVWEEEWKNT